MTPDLPNTEKPSLAQLNEVQQLGNTEKKYENRGKHSTGKIFGI